MDKESRFILQCLDTNCNDCIHMERDFEKFHRYDELHEGRENSKTRANYGSCKKLDKEVSFIPNWPMAENRDCFCHRRKEKFDDVYDEYISDLV